jgi:hypothetical protein
VQQLARCAKAREAKQKEPKSEAKLKKNLQGKIYDKRRREKKKLESALERGFESLAQEASAKAALAEAQAQATAAAKAAAALAKAAAKAAAALATAAAKAAAALAKAEAKAKARAALELQTEAALELQTRNIAAQVTLWLNSKGMLDKCIHSLLHSGSAPWQETSLDWLKRVRMFMSNHMPEDEFACMDMEGTDSCAPYAVSVWGLRGLARTWALNPFPEGKEATLLQCQVLSRAALSLSFSVALSLSLPRAVCVPSMAVCA